MATARRGALWALLLLPGALAVYTAFHGGGFFAGTQGKVAVLLALILLLRFTVAENPFGGASAGLAVAGGALALLAGWILLSASWSDAPAAPCWSSTAPCSTSSRSRSSGRCR